MGKKQTSTNEDQLVLMHRNARIKKKRKLIVTAAIVLAVALIVLTVAVLLLRKTVQNQVRSSSTSEVLSAEVTVGSISTTVSGSGTLAAETVKELEISSAVEVVDYYVEEGDYVEKGDLIATVTTPSVLTAMAEKQEELEELDEELKEVSGDEINDTITAGAAGRVKKVYVAANQDVTTAMYEHGALMLLSLDGYMSVEIETDAVSAGNDVTVTLSDGTVVSGLVERQVNGTAVILVSDNGTAYQDTVTVQDESGNTLGEGTLDIHSKMAVVGYAGTVSSVSVSENEKVSSGETLVKLTDTETSANYDALLNEREEIEEQLNALIKIYKEGGVCAPISGTVDSLEETDSAATGTSSMYGMQMSSVATTTTSNNATTVVASISSDTNMEVSISIDETDILSISEGQEATLSIESIGEETFTGTVTEVNTAATSESGVTSYTAVISLEKTAQMLSGMTASVVITIEGNDNAKLIPIDALHQTSATAYVYTEYDESTGQYGGMKEVTIGLSNSSYVEITEGLEEGDVVYYTETEENAPFGNMPGFGGSGFGGGMPDMGNMPSGGGMPDMGNMPSGGGFGGGMPGGRGGN